MQMNPPEVVKNHANAPSYDDLVHTLELIRHATAPEPDDGGHHEAAHDLADAMLRKVEARRAYVAAQGAAQAKTGELIEHLQKTGRLAPCFNLPALDAARELTRKA